MNWLYKPSNIKTEDDDTMSLDSPNPLKIIERKEECLKQPINELRDIYIIIKMLGSGAFGEVYLSKHIEGGHVALKMEDTTKIHRVKNEYRIYNYLRKKGMVQGLPKIYDFIETEEYNIMVMQLLGPSIEDIFKKNNKHFSLRTTIKLGLNLIDLMESLHSKGFLHRDIKPHNFMIDRKKNSEQLYIVDFGLSRKYRSRTGDHIPFKNNRSLIGTARYASINMHNGIEPTRRDDLESIGYMLVYLIKGRLPWQGLKKQEGIPGVKLIGEKKKEVELDDLCSELPKCFLKYLIYCRSLDFDEQPDYAKLKQYFLNDISSLKIELKYDWER